MSKPIAFTRGRGPTRGLALRLENLKSFPLSHMPMLEKPRPIARQLALVKRLSLAHRHLVVMVKDPVAGRVKTRLARGLGNARAAAFYRVATSTVVSRLASSGRWRTYLGIAPDAAVLGRAWPSNSGSQLIYRFAQGNGNLGQRMQRVFDGMPIGPVVIIGSDVPAITQEHIERAFRSLGRSDAVVGPSPDGGYWLFGMRRVPRVLQAFVGVRWSSIETLGDTLQNLGGVRVARVGVLADIDEVHDYEHMGDLAARRVLPVGARQTE